MDQIGSQIVTKDQTNQILQTNRISRRDYKARKQGEKSRIHKIKTPRKVSKPLTPFGLTKSRHFWWDWVRKGRSQSKYYHFCTFLIKILHPNEWFGKNPNRFFSFALKSLNTVSLQVTRWFKQFGKMARKVPKWNSWLTPSLSHPNSFLFFFVLFLSFLEIKEGGIRIR